MRFNKVKSLLVIITLFILIFSPTITVGLQTFHHQKKEFRYDSNFLSDITSFKALNTNTQIKPMGSFLKASAEKEWIVFASRLDFEKTRVLINKLNVKILKEYPVLKAFRILTVDQNVFLIKRFASVFDTSSIKIKLNSLPPQLPSIRGVSDYTPLNVSGVWNQGINGSSVVIGLLDTTVDYSGVLAGKQFITKVFGQSSSTNMEWVYHATKVASIMVGYDSINKQPFGVAYGAKLANAQLGTDNQGNLIGDVFEAMNWLGSIPEVKIINFSFGTMPFGDEDPIELAAEALVKEGKLVISSAGNDGKSYWYKVGSPGTSNELISVGASSSNTSIAYFSSGGPTYYYEPKPDVVAPGLNVEVRPNEYRSGTSFSAPIVSGIAALLADYLQKNHPDKYSNGLIKASIIKSASPITNDIRIEGQGIVNAYNALKILKEGISSGGIVSVQPYKIPYDVFYRTAANGTVQQRILVTTNILKTLQYSVTGNISQYISIHLHKKGILTNVYDFKFKAPNSPGKSFTGKITFYLPNGANSSSKINFLVDEKFSSIALIDLRHTRSDDFGYDLFKGDNLGTFLDLLEQHGIYPELMRSGNLSQLELDRYSFIFMPDVFDTYSKEYNEYLPSTFLYQEEKQALTNYLDNGGKLFVDFSGLFSSGGTNYSKLIDLTLPFGYSIYPSLLNTTKPITASYLNTSWINSNTPNISYLGPYFVHCSLRSIPVFQQNGKPVATLMTTKNKGFIFLLATNFALDNKGLAGQYSFIQNKNFVEPLIDKLTKPAPFYIEKLKINSETFELAIQSSNPVFVKTQQQIFSLSLISTNTYYGKIPIPPNGNITVFNKEGFLKWELSNDHVELPSISFLPNQIVPSEWIKIAVLKYEHDRMPPQAIQFFVDNKEIPVYVEKNDNGNYNVWVNSNITPLLKKFGNHKASFIVFNTQWKSLQKDYTLNIVSQINTQSPPNNSTENSGFLNYEYSWGLILAIMVHLFYKKRRN